MNAQELIETVGKPRNPRRTFAYDKLTKTLIAVKTPDGDWYPVASQAITGQWASLSYEILCNGKRMIDVLPGNEWVQA